MPYGSSLIDSGPTPDLALHRDLIAGVNYPTAKLIDATEGSFSPIGVDANPLRVRTRARGTQAYDSGLVTLPDLDTELTSVTVYPAAAYLHNTSLTQAVRVTVQNTAGKKYLDEHELLPKQVLILPLHHAALVGVRWHASAPGTVNGQIVGEQ